MPIIEIITSSESFECYRIISFCLNSQFICGFRDAHFLGKSMEGASVETKRTYFHSFSTLIVEWDT